MKYNSDIYFGYYYFNHTSNRAFYNTTPDAIPNWLRYALLDMAAASNEFATKLAQSTTVPRNFALWGKRKG